nr:phage tail tape measure protein [uncultured Acetatifactor sp.]
MDNEFLIKLTALLDQAKSKKMINADIKALQTAVNSLKLVATFSRAESKKELNAYIKQLNGQLSTLKLKAKIDNKNLKSEINKTLRNASFKDIDLLNIDENKAKLKVKKVIADAKAYAEKNPISVSVDMKREKLYNDLTTFLNKNSKIRESSVLLEESERVRELINSVDDRGTLKNATEAFQLYKSEVSATGYATKSTTEKIKEMLSHVTKIGSFFGLASLTVNNFAKSLKTLRSNDTILTEISKTSEMTKRQLEELGNEAFKVASKYGQLSNGYLLGVQEMARSGYEDLSKELGELSLLTQSAGDMTAENANNYLLATDAAYKYGGSIEKLNAALDGANYISNRNSASLTDIADATRVSASFAANAGVAIDEMTAAEATMIATTKRSGSEIGRAFRSIVLNLQQVSGEFDGEVIDEDQLKKVEARCHSLGVELEYMKDGMATLRNPMEVLKDLAKVYNSLPDNSADKQGLISDLGGKYHANALSSLLSRWDLYEKMLGEFSQGTGSALKEAEKTANSWEGRLNSLQNSFDSFVNSLTNKQAIMNGVSFFDRMIQGAESLIDAVGEIPVMVMALNTAMTAVNKDYGITQIYDKDKGKLDIQGNIFGIDITNIKNMKNHFAEAEKAICGWNAELLTGNEDINKFGESVVQNNAQLKAYLSTCSKDAPASLSGYKSFLNAAGVETDALRLKTVLLNAAISFGIGVAIQASVKAISTLYELSQMSDTVAENAKDLGAEFKSSALDIESYKSKIEELYKTINDSGASISDVTEARKNLMTIQDELIEKYGTEQDSIYAITDAINGQADAFDRLTEKQWQATKNELNDGGLLNDFANWRDGYKDNIDRMVGEMEDVQTSVNGLLADFGQNAELIDALEAAGYRYDETANGAIMLSGSLENVYDDILNIQKIASGYDAPDEFLKNLTNRANEVKETLENYQDVWDIYVLQDRIFANEELADSWHDVNEAYSEYKKAFESGDGTAITGSIDAFAKTLSSVLSDNNVDQSVKDYFRNMYPALQQEVSEWQFKANFEPNTDGLKDKVEKVLSDFGGVSTESLSGFNADVATDQQIASYESLKNTAREYGMEISQLINLLQEMGIVQSESYQQLAGLFGEDNISKIAPEDLEIAYSIENVGDITFDELLKEIQRIKDESGKTQAFDFSTYEESIDGIQSAITTLRSALDSFNKGELDSISVIDLMQQFPGLAPYIDLAADGFGNLSEGLSALIAQQPDSLIQRLNELKDALSTDEERQQVDLLIDSLQRLSSYGDTGMEAYATTIGDTWNDTANVIDGVTNQFENLAKVQEAVADGLTMSATAAAELARMYPEILDHAEVTANGQITLNEEVVNSILDGDKSIIDAQIAKLEADKAVLEAKKETAIAELEIANQVGNAKGQISEEEARHQIEVLNAELNAEIDKDRQTVESYAMATQSKAQNATDFNIYAATVASDIASNMAKAAASMAESMRINSVNAQQSLSGIMQKAADVAKAIAEMATGAVSGAIDKVYSAVGGVDSGGISVSTSANGFTPTTSSYLAGDISLGEFKSGLEADIQGYIDAISNIDSQIEILKNLQLTFDSNGGIGGHGYADKVKDLEKEKEKLNEALKDKTGSGSGSGTDSAKSEFEDTVDFFERRIEALNDVLSLLKDSLDNVSGSFAKNKLVDAELGVTEEEFNNYTDALAMYTQKANEALSKLPADIAAKVKDGAVALTDFIGDGNKDVVEAIKEYEAWADKVSDCQQELAGLKKEIRQLELDKFNNIMDDFSNQFNLRGNSKDMISKQIDLLKEAGELIGESFFKAQIDQSQKQLGLLENEKAQLVNQMSSAISSGRIQSGTEEWLSMVDALNSVEGNILDCKKSIEEFDNELLNLHTEVFNRIQEQFSNLDSEISNIIDLFDGMEVSDDKGVWSKEGITQLGLLAQQYELAQHQVQQYNDEIDGLKAQYLAGRYSATEYADRLAELSSAQWDAVKSAESAKDAIMDLNEARVENAVKGIEKEIDAYKELIDAQKDSLIKEKELHDYKQSIADKNKAVADIERQIIALQYDTSAAGVAKRKKLEEQLVEAKKTLAEAEYEHSIEVQQEALDKQYENYEKERNDEIESLRASLNQRDTIIAESFETVKNNASLVGQEIANIAVEHGITISDTLISSWQSGEQAIASYGEALSQNTSAFIGNIMAVEAETWKLQAQANSTANTLAWMFSTKADNLVNELMTSYYSEANLASMTNTLQQSLISTLERGYNVSAIVNSLASVESAARSAKAALDAMNASAGSGGGTSGYGSGGDTSGTTSSTGSGWTKPSHSPTPPSGRTQPSQKATVSYEVRSASGVLLTTLDHHPSQEELATLRARFAGQLGANKNLKVNKVGGYAKGVHRLSRDEVAWTQEKGDELILSPGRNAMLTPLKKGDTVLTAEQTDRLYELSKGNSGMIPFDPFKDDLFKIWGNVKMPEPVVDKRINAPTVYNHYDSMLTINGDVNDLKNLKAQMQEIADRSSIKIADQRIERSWRKFGEGLKKH